MSTSFKAFLPYRITWLRAIGIKGATVRQCLGSDQRRGTDFVAIAIGTGARRV